jgi:hypothetical protein
MAESTIGLFKTELIRRRGPWRTLDDVEIATLEWFGSPCPRRPAPAPGTSISRGAATLARDVEGVGGRSGCAVRIDARTVAIRGQRLPSRARTLGCSIAIDDLFNSAALRV